LIQALLLRQIVGTTELGHAAAEAYARRKGVSTETFLAGFGNRSARVIMASTSQHCLPIPIRERDGVRIRGDTGIQPLDK